MNDPSSQPASQPVEQLPIPLFDGVVLAARAHDGAIYLALRLPDFLKGQAARSKTSGNSTALMRR